jgi:hypothetical protein
MDEFVGKMLITVIYIISFIIKLYLHKYIGDRNDNRINYGHGFDIAAIWFYTKPVSGEFEKHKKVCNLLQVIILTSLLLLIIDAIFDIY